MAGRILISFWLMAIFVNSFHRVSGFGDNSTVPVNTSLHQDVCEDILLEEIEDFIHQMDLVDEVEIRPPSQLVLFFSDNLEKAINLFQHLDPKPDRDFQNIHLGDPSQEFLERARESIFQFKENGTSYHVYPGINGMKNEIFTKYLTYKVTDKAPKIKITLFDIVPDFFNNQTDSNTPNKTSSNAMVSLMNLHQIAEIFCTNGSQYTTIQIHKEFTHFRHFSYEFEVNVIQDCDTCIHLEDLIKFHDYRTYEDIGMLRYQTSSDIFRDKFLQSINEDISFEKIDEKYLNFTSFSNQRLTEVMKCVENKLYGNLTSDLAKVFRLLHTYFSDVEKNSTRGKNFFARQDFPWRFNDELIREDHTNAFVSMMKYSFEFIEIKGEIWILSRIEKSMEQLRFLQSSRRDKVNSTQLFNHLNDFFGNNVFKTMSFYKKLYGLYRETINGSHVTIEQKLMDLWKQVDSEPDNVDVKKEALRDFERSLSESKRECVLLEDVKPDNEEGKLYKLKIHGDIIKISNIPYYWDNICGGKTRYLELFSRDTIVIDDDFRNGFNTLQIVAIAPKLKIIGNRTIQLLTDFSSDGKSGAVFIGVSEEIINGNLLEIRANGPRFIDGKAVFSKQEYRLDDAGQIFLCQLNDTSGTGSDFKDLPSVVEDYKNFVRPYLSGSEKSGKLTDFYGKLTNSRDIYKSYSSFF